ncbi:glycerophosphoryl diester phosphodiesterase membrane domain-containing protein [Altererythrobacter sp.]|uniref:glycerophosphoryl diester phosphodiesterase membrane domain-containing protein n=1 Tax=Altererythrobacter sp. TaxID=1872480 RepID=UPI003CFDED47
MKLDMGQAWNAAIAMLTANRSVVMIVAGVFFFLPSLALVLLLPESVQPPAETADPKAALEAMMQIYTENWWAVLLSSVAQGIGMLALLALLTDRSRPTVGEALKRGASGFPSYLGAQLLLAFGVALVIGLPLGAAAASGVGALIAVLVIAAVVFMLYAVVKGSLIPQVIAIDGILNPVQVLKRSWQLTKGNSVRLLVFYVLLAVAMGVLLIIATMIFGLILAVIGGDIEVIGNGVISSAINAIFVTVFLAVLAAVHRQLAGPSTEAVSETFE